MDSCLQGQGRERDGMGRDYMVHTSKGNAEGKDRGGAIGMGGKRRGGARGRGILLQGFNGDRRPCLLFCDRS